MTLEESIQLAVEGNGAKLYDIVSLKENDNNIYRIYITAPEGVSLDKCAEISRQISPLLDIHEPMNGKYHLEVSSPGIERKLKKTNHFISSVGEKVKIKDFDKNVIEGELVKADENEIVVKTAHGEEQITYDEISSASTYFEW
ncbi:ribosome maturation factor RimP [Candidatus Marinarcus aquaticus]|uniref:Ribosome maturation factor RimP n=1 Tax=Candidatus Marinarcus aquaticus TaxID=2044504 RepID=A0A4V1LNZ2_9BACT|nr:ribosome maturation factor RimP [Candidatus Marinarcus aquaticus]RXJ57710.1 ribosome maturation factor RimP [Candidatus Marinarcus aquaticus]